VCVSDKSDAGFTSFYVHARARARVCKNVLSVDTSITALLQHNYSPYLYLLVSLGTKSCTLLGYRFGTDYLLNEEDFCEDVMMIIITETGLIRQRMRQYVFVLLRNIIFIIRHKSGFDRPVSFGLD
jgi:hypothetical protein